MKILLVNTNRISPPIAPIAMDYIGSAAAAAGHEIELLDFCWSDDPDAEVRTVLSGEDLDVVAVSFRNTDDCYFASRASFLPLLKRDVESLRAHGLPPGLHGATSTRMD